MSLLSFFKRNQENLWDKVYEKRKLIWENQFGPYPEQVSKLMNLSGIWVGGCLVQTFSEKLGGIWV